MKEFKFNYANGKGGFYFLMMLFGVPLGILLPSFFLLDYLSWIFYISIPIGIGLIVYCVRQFIKKSKGMDTITLDNEGFTSSSYGRVLYSDIHSIPPYRALQAPPPSMRIKLRSGKKLTGFLVPTVPKLRMISQPLPLFGKNFWTISNGSNKRQCPKSGYRQSTQERQMTSAFNMNRK